MVDFRKALDKWIAAGRPEFNFEQYNFKQIEGEYKMAIANASKLSAMWKKVTPIAASFSNIPDGDYVGDLKSMVVGQAKKGRWQVVFDWEVADGEQAGQTQKQFYGISDDNGNPDEKGMGYLKNVFEIMGHDASSEFTTFEELKEVWNSGFEQFLAENANALYDIHAKANGNYTNVFVNGVSDWTKGAEAPAEEGEAAEEEAAEEEVVDVAEEEVVEEVEEEVQEVVAPVKRTVAVAKPVAKPVAKAVAKPLAKPVAKAAPAKMSAQPAKRVVPLRK